MTDKAAQTKETVISGLVQVRRRILETAASLSLARQDEVFLGTWSVKDLLAHLVGWDYANLEAAQAILSGRMPAFYEHHDRGWKTFNAQLVARYRKDDYAELLSSVQESHQQLIGFLRTIPAEEFNRDRGLRFRRYKVTIARLLEVEIKDENEHHQQIQELKDKGSPIGSDTAA